MKQKTLSLFLAVLLLFASTVTAFAAYENTYVNTGNQAEDILGVAMTQEGYMEGSLDGTVAGSDNYTKYGVWWTNETNWGVDYSHGAWCSMFVSWCAAQAGIPASIVYRTAGCDEGVAKAKARNIWHFSPANGGDYTPQRGDLIFFGTTSDSDHVGLVKSVSGTRVYTIEGNSSNKVSQRNYLLTASGILGYASPQYTDTSGAAQSGRLADRLQSAEKLLIDVSKWQGTIDWTQTASAVDGAILRIGYRASSSRSLIIDPYFIANYNGAKAAGLPVGCYFYSDARNTADAVQEAAWVLETLRSNGCAMELPVFYDMESSAMASLSRTKLTEIARAFCDELLAADWLPGVYMNKSWATNKVNLTALEDCAIWIAQYNTSCTYAGHYDMWQYTDKGAVAGISGDVDMDHCYVDYTAYIQAQGLNGVTAAGTEPQQPAVYAAEETYVITAAAGTSVFASADPDAAVGTLPAQQQVFVYEVSGHSGRILYNAEEGWIDLTDAVMLKDTAVFGESLGKYTVTATNLNVRSGPGTTYTALGQLPNGTAVEVIALSGIWCKIDYNGRDGWLSSAYLEYVSQTLLDSNQGTGTNTVCTAAVGETITLPACPYTRDGFTFLGWSLTRDGAVNYADGAVLTAEKANRLLYAVWEAAETPTADAGETYLVQVTSTLNVRLGPDTSYDRIGAVTNDTQLYIYETANGWGRILWNGEAAWVSLSYVKPLKDTALTEAIPGYYQVTAAQLHVRAGAGTGYDSLGTLSEGDVICATERSGIWCKIEFNGRTGWTSANYLAHCSRCLLDSNRGTGLNAYALGRDGAALALPANDYTRDGYVFAGWSAEKDGAVDYADGATVTLGTTDTILYAVWQEDKVAVYAADGSETVVNENNHSISGLAEGLTAPQLLASYVTSDENVTLTVSTAAVGTGTVVTATRADGKTASYTVVIYGDVDGDGAVDARDAVLTQAYLQYHLTFMDLPRGASWAMDLDGDGQIDSAEADAMLASGLRTVVLPQTR